MFFDLFDCFCLKKEEEVGMDEIIEACTFYKYIDDDKTEILII
tara:strand:+ start:10445 stop:10573 length:129 start_codon:yes stop_codon:yes gene_type:complete